MFDINIGLENFSNMEIGAGFVCLMGVGTVFLGLICLILVCKFLGLFGSKKQDTGAPAATPIIAPTSAEPVIENKQELLAAISAAVAEELGTDVNGIRITSFKKL